MQSILKDSQEALSNDFWPKLKRRALILWYILPALKDGLTPVNDYGELTREVRSSSTEDYSQFRLHCRLRAACWVMIVCQFFRMKWACREYSIMCLRACLRERAPAALTFEVRNENGTFRGHMSVRKPGSEADSQCSVDFPFCDSDEGPWKRG